MHESEMGLGCLFNRVTFTRLHELSELMGKSQVY